MEVSSPTLIANLIAQQRRRSGVYSETRVPHESFRYFPRVHLVHDLSHPARGTARQEAQASPGPSRRRAGPAGKFPGYRRILAHVDRLKRGPTGSEIQGPQMAL